MTSTRAEAWRSQPGTKRIGDEGLSKKQRPEWAQEGLDSYSYEAAGYSNTSPTFGNEFNGESGVTDITDLQYTVFKGLGNDMNIQNSVLKEPYWIAKLIIWYF